MEANGLCIYLCLSREDVLIVEGGLQLLDVSLGSVSLMRKRYDGILRMLSSFISISSSSISKRSFGIKPYRLRINSSYDGNGEAGWD